MRKLLTGLLLFASVAWGVSFSTVESEGTLTVVGVATLQSATMFPDGTAALPSISNTGDPNTGIQFPAADTIGFSANGAQVATMTATGLNACAVGQTVPAAADFTTLTTTGITDLFVGAVGAPSVTFTGSATTGYYQTAADEIGVAVGGANVGTWSATGLAAVGLDGPVGLVAPNAGVFTTVQGTDATFTGDFEYGQGPEDLQIGYKDRSEYITFQDAFTDGVDATYAVKWNVAGVVGAGTNTVTVRDGWSELVTGVNAADMESTVSVGLCNLRAYEPRLETVVELTAVNTQRFEIGFYIGAAELVEIIYDTAQGPNWMLEVDDNTGVERADSGIAVVGGTPYKLEIQVDNAGAITWAVDDVAMPVAAIATNVMTANPYSTRWMLTNIAAAVNTGAVDYVQIETLKQP